MKFVNWKYFIALYILINFFDEICGGQLDKWRFLPQRAASKILYTVYGRCVRIPASELLQLSHQLSNHFHRSPLHRRDKLCTLDCPRAPRCKSMYSESLEIGGALNNMLHQSHIPLAVAHYLHLHPTTLTLTLTKLNKLGTLMVPLAWSVESVEMETAELVLLTTEGVEVAVAESKISTKYNRKKCVLIWYACLSLSKSISYLATKQVVINHAAWPATTDH